MERCLLRHDLLYTWLRFWKKAAVLAFIEAFPLYKSANGMPFNTIQYNSVPFNTIEDIKGKFVILNGTLIGKTNNEWYKIRQ